MGHTAYLLPLALGYAFAIVIAIASHVPTNVPHHQADLQSEQIADI